MITNFGLNMLANSTKNTVVKVVLNGTEGVTEFDLHEASDNTYNLRFFVPSYISTITQIDLMDADGNAIASNRLFVEVEKSAIFRYVLKFNNAR